MKETDASQAPSNLKPGKATTKTRTSKTKAKKAVTELAVSDGTSIVQEAQADSFSAAQVQTENNSLSTPTQDNNEHSAISAGDGDLAAPSHTDEQDAVKTVLDAVVGIDKPQNEASQFSYRRDGKLVTVSTSDPYDQVQKNHQGAGFSSIYPPTKTAEEMRAQVRKDYPYLDAMWYLIETYLDEKARNPKDYINSTANKLGLTKNQVKSRVDKYNELGWTGFIKDGELANRVVEFSESVTYFDDQLRLLELERQVKLLQLVTN